MASYQSLIYSDARGVSMVTLLADRRQTCVTS